MLSDHRRYLMWIDNLKSSDPVLADLLGKGRVLTHCFFTGELALGGLLQRRTVLEFLRDPPQAAVARGDDIMMLIEREQLYGLQIGFVGAHLPAAVELTPGACSGPGIGGCGRWLRDWGFLQTSLN